MIKENNIILEQVKNTKNQIVIKSGQNMVIGRIFILEHNDINKNCTIRLKFYKSDNESLLTNVLKTVLKDLFTHYKLNKINIITDEDILISSFTSIGFFLEGILEDNVYVDNTFKNEYIFGITNLIFNSGENTNILKLFGESISLKVLTPEDANDLQNFYIKNKLFLKPFEPTRTEEFFTLENQKKVLSESYKNYLNGLNINMGIFKNKSFIGKIQLSNIVLGSFRSGTLGYSIDEDEQGKGYMKEAINLLCEYSFMNLELHRIEASTLLNNKRSQNVLLSTGFKELGINKNYLFINGKWRDHITFYKISAK